MYDKEKMRSINSFNNPFEDINANVIDTKRLVEYWCSPFKLGLLTNFDEHKFRTSRIPVILQGSRGSGKTTILKYFSFSAQVERANINNRKILSIIKEEEEVGFYYRLEDSFISTFKAIFERTNKNEWASYFDCYIELAFVENVLKMFFVLYEKGEINNFPNEKIKEITSKFGILSCYSINDLYNYVHNAIIYYEEYKNRAIFTDEKFMPNVIFNIFSLSATIVNELKSFIPQLKNVLFVIMLDEFENLNEELQKRFNTVLKFARKDISLRIGRRSEGLVTSATINDTEYLRENHDFFLASLDKEIGKDNTSFKNYFRNVANKRFLLTDSVYNKENLDIVDILGDKEDLDNECKNICGKKKKHIEVILKQSPELATDKTLRNNITKIIQNDDNPIAETINALWVVREKKNYLQKAHYTADTMNAFFEKKTVSGVTKYKDDYTNKYRYAITIFICSVYKKDKLYYGFNTISYLANGNVRTFINFCRSIVSDAMFYEKDTFMKTKRISYNTQSRAINNFSRSEFDSICSIMFSGDHIRKFILNLGNSFSVFHKDKKIRYPETNQFVFDELLLNVEDRKVLKTAESWAIIIKRSKNQRISVSSEERADLYYMNKMFCPIFNISYRTRGGINLNLNAEEIHEMLWQDSYYPRSVQRLIASQEITVDRNEQGSLFDEENDE